MGAFQCGDDAFELCQFVSGADSLVVIYGEYDGAFPCGKVGVHGTYARIIQSGGDGVRFLNLPVLVLDNVGASSMNDAQFAEGDGGGRHARFHSFTAGFGENYLRAFVVDIVVNGSGGIASAAYAGYEIVRTIAPFLFHELLLNLLADNRLQACHHIGIGMRAYGGADDVIGVGRVAAPVAYGLVGGVFQGHVAAGYGDYGCSQHLHFLYVDVLTLHIGLAHIYDALHIHQCADGGGGDAVLSRSCLGDDAVLAHAARQQNLADGVVDFVRAGVVQVFPFQINPATVLLRQAFGLIQRRRTPYVVAQQLVVLPLEILTLQNVEIGVLQLLYTSVEYLGNVCPAEFSVIAFFVN